MVEGISFIHVPRSCTIQPRISRRDTFYFLGSIIESSPLHSYTDYYDCFTTSDEINRIDLIYFPYFYHVDDPL